MLKGYPHRNSRGNPRFPPQLGENHEIPLSSPDEAQIPHIGSRTIPHSPSNTTGCLTSFNQLQRFPEHTITRLDEHRGPHSNSRRAPCTQNHLEMRANSHSSIGEEFRCSTHTRSTAFSHLFKLETNPEVPALSRKDIMFPLSST